MKMYSKLVRTFLLSGEMPKSEKAKKKNFYITLGIIATVFIFIPCFILMTFLVAAATSGIKGEILNNMAYAGNIGNALLLVIQFICIFSMIFGFNIILNTFYFSGDIEHILPLPIKPKLLISSKFMAVLISESIMEFLFLIAAFLGFLIIDGVSISTALMSLIGIITLPILPLVYCGIIALLIMRFTKLIKNKNNMLTLVMLGVIIVVGMIAIGYLNNDSITEFIPLLAQGKVGFLDIMNIIFPIHPRTKKTLENFGLFDKLNNLEHVHIIKPLGYLDFLLLTSMSTLILTDSGGLQEEAITLNVPALTLRYNTERPETVTAGGNILVGSDKEVILENARKILEDEEFANNMRNAKNPYGDGNSAKKILNIITEYFFKK